jgi:hypothetical protein
MGSQKHRKLALLWYWSLLVIDAAYAFYLGLCLLCNDAPEDSWASDLAEFAIMGVGSWFLLFYCTHLILTCVILVRGPMLLRRRVALWYLFPVVSLYGFSQCSPHINIYFLLPCIALFVMIALPVTWLYMMKMQDA